MELKENPTLQEIADRSGTTTPRDLLAAAEESGLSVLDCVDTSQKSEDRQQAVADLFWALTETEPNPVLTQAETGIWIDILKAYRLLVKDDYQVVNHRRLNAFLWNGHTMADGLRDLGHEFE